MYQIIQDGKVIAYAENIEYIKKLDNGSYGLTSYLEATGIAVKGTPYHLEGREEMGDLPTVSFTTVDLAQKLLELDQKVTALAEAQAAEAE